MAGLDDLASAVPAVLDPARLSALEANAILETPAEDGFDDIVRLAARLCAAPVALVSLVAADRQWFKANIGFPRCETDMYLWVCKFVLVFVSGLGERACLPPRPPCERKCQSVVGRIGTPHRP